MDEERIMTRRAYPQDALFSQKYTTIKDGLGLTKFQTQCQHDNSRLDEFKPYGHQVDTVDNDWNRFVPYQVQEQSPDDVVEGVPPFEPDLRRLTEVLDCEFYHESRLRTESLQRASQFNNEHTFFASRDQIHLIPASDASSSLRSNHLNEADFDQLVHIHTHV